MWKESSERCTVERKEVLILYRYFSYGASLDPSYWSVFRASYNIIKKIEGTHNDGLVRFVNHPNGLACDNRRSIRSSRWGEYKGTLAGVSHLDLINWTNRLKWYIWELAGQQRK